VGVARPDEVSMMKSFPTSMPKSLMRGSSPVAPPPPTPKNSFPPRARYRATEACSASLNLAFVLGPTISSTVQLSGTPSASPPNFTTS